MTSALFSWAALNIIQIIALYLLARRRNLTRVGGDAAVVVPFWNDYFFLTWNVFCAGFAVYFAYFTLLNPAQLITSSFQAGVTGQLENNFTRFVAWVNFLDAWNVEFAFYCVFILLAIKAQMNNIGRSTKYWWHKQNCPIIWRIRLIFLSVNVLLVAYISWKIAVFILNFFALNQFQSVSVELFHEDGFGSLGGIGHAFVISTSIFLLRALMGVVGLLDHTRVKRVDPIYIAGDLYNIADGIAALVSFGAFLSVTHSAMLEAVSSTKTYLGGLCDFSSGADRLASCDPTHLALWFRLSEIQMYPFSLQDFGIVLAAWAVPLLFQISSKAAEGRI